MSLVGGFAVRIGDALAPCPQNVQRLVAFLAVRGRPQRRSAVAGNLWMDTTDDRAGANLRTTLWRARQLLGPAVVVNGDDVGLADDVDVDLHTILERARRLLEPAMPADLDADPADLLGELLPGWDEDWLTFERLRTRQLCVHALEALCQQLSTAGRAGQAVDAGLAAVDAEPLRESAHRALIAAHLGEGNLFEARRQYDSFRALTREHLGVEPSASLRALVETGWPLKEAIGATGPRGAGDRWARAGSVVTGRGTAVP